MLNEKYDVVIVGAGAAGLMASVTAKKKGLKVLVLEKGAAVGGNAVCAGTIFSTALKDWGDYDNDRDNVNALYAAIMKELHYLGNPRLIRRYISRAKDVARYFEETGLPWVHLSGGGFGFPGSINVEYFEGTVSLGAFLVREMKKDCEKLGVEIITKARGKALIQDEEGKVIGITAEIDGADTDIAADTVILSCGGVAGSPESIGKYLPRVQQPGDEIRPAGVPYCVGDGIEMCEAIGAETRKNMNIHLLPPWFGGHEFTREGLIFEDARALYLRKDGRRLMNEEVGFRDIMDVTNAAPGKVVYAIFDANAFKELWEETSDVNNLPPWVMKFANRINFNAKLENLEKDYAADFRHGAIYKAETLEDAAAFMGADSAILKATVDEYNKAVETGIDEYMGKSAEKLVFPVKDGPFYVLKGVRQVDSTQGGITVNEFLQPLTPEGKAISGVYVCGDHVTGFAAENYYGPGGAGLTFALVSGMMAAEQAAE